MNATVHELCLELEDEFLDHLQDDFLAQGREGNHRVQTVAEFRREDPFDGGRIFARAAFAAEPMAALAMSDALRWRS